MEEALAKKDIVLLGAGHTNAHIIRMWRMKRLPGVRLTCVSDHLEATYSGMLAGMLAGKYDEDRMKIDLVRLCASCGVRLVHGRGVGLDAGRQELLVEGRPPIHYDALSIGIGSRPRIAKGGESGLSIKPMQTFLGRLRSKLDELLESTESEALKIAIVGGGAAGVEVACCLDEFLQRNYDVRQSLLITIVDSKREILVEKPLRARRFAEQELQRRGIELQLGERIERVDHDRTLVCESGQRIDADLIIWATSARPAGFLGELGLELDERGFLLIRPTLQVVGDDSIFAVGDCGTLADDKYAKAGVFAVRQGPVLWDNLQRKLRGEPLAEWKRQRNFLSLIYTGGERAILTYRNLSFHGHWCWRWKDRIDSRFMDKYQDYAEPMMLSAPAEEEFDISQQCGGCGCKASPRVLAESLSSFEQVDDPRVLVGLGEAEDVAVVQQSSGGAVAVSTDFFSAFVDDPFLLGRIAALNAMSDLFAKGAKPSAALSIATIPPGTEEQQARLLRELLAGAAREFQPAGVTIVGGHSVVGPRLTFGFTILGETDPQRMMKKSSPRAGDVLVLTKALGTGVLLAAHMRAKCPAPWWSALVESMLLSNEHAVMAAEAFDATAATDVTGFGLARHLLEMLAGGVTTAEIFLGRLPVLPGANELISAGVESTLLAANRNGCEELEIDSQLSATDAVDILYDPQTSGGLLLAMSAAEAEEFQKRYSPVAVVIGQLRERKADGPKVLLRP